MTQPSPQSPRRRTPAFRPRFTIGLLYLVGFFFLFSFLQVLPELVLLLSDMPAGPAQEQAASAIAREGTNPLLSALLSLVATLLGSHYEVLPGMRAG